MSDTKTVNRPRYTQMLQETLDSPAIKVLTGIRRCGKSTILGMLADNLRNQGTPESNLLFLRLASYEVPLEPDAAWLDESLEAKLALASADYPLYVFLDEIQEVPGWEKPVRRLHESGKARIYLTGSNASLLASDLASRLSGRYIEIPVFPLSFSEYLTFCDEFGKNKAPALNERSGNNALFDSFLRYGGMPGLFAATDFDQASVLRELTAIHDTVLLNDVAKRFNVRDVDLLEKLLRYIYTTSGSLFSPNKVAGALTSMGRKTNAETIDNYLAALKRAFALYECQQVGITRKKVLLPLRKYYAPDTGLRNRESGFMMKDIGFQLENVVYMELLRRGYDVQVGTLEDGEIDFVATRASERLYVQVCENMLDEKTKAREIAPLDSVKDSFTKLILTRDELATGITETGVRIVYLLDWLLDEAW